MKLNTYRSHVESNETLICTYGVFWVVYIIIFTLFCSHYSLSAVADKLSDGEFEGTATSYASRSTQLANDYVIVQ